MTAIRSQPGTQRVLDRNDLQALFDVLHENGFAVRGPALGENAIIYDTVSSVDDLPVGWIDQQDGGTYRLIRSDSERVFGYVVGPQSWKKFLYPPERLLWEARRDGRSFRLLEQEGDPVKQAFVGVRSCELHAMAIHDNVLKQGAYVDRAYVKAHQNVFIVAVNCTRAGGTCFCASMNTGPLATHGFDLVLTEVVDGNNHYFLVESGSPSGADVLGKLPCSEAGEQQIRAAADAVQQAASNMGRTLDAETIRDVLNRSHDHPHWEEIAARCLTCGNCTMVCPTCFCVNAEDATDLTGQSARRVRRWDSCFTVGFSYIHGGSIRTSVMSRYRQWMMHKLTHWHDQFGTSGCVGCGRCITWCPVGIDITQEARYFQEASRENNVTTVR
jgi:sulfhydrogenase subunit beta (sulfur reductase)